MKHSTGNPTKAEAARFRKLKALGCVACDIDKTEQDQCEPDIHHMLSGNRRIGHHATVPLCYWHHKGEPYDGMPEAYLLATVGPSWHRHRRKFRAQYGGDLALIARVDEMIADKKTDR